MSKIQSLDGYCPTCGSEGAPLLTEGTTGMLCSDLWHSRRSLRLKRVRTWLTAAAELAVGAACMIILIWLLLHHKAG